VTGYILRRLVWGLAVLAAITLVTFFLSYVLPADPARMVAGPQARPEDVEAIRHALGLDRPFLAQLGTYIGNVLQGNFGHSFTENKDVLPILLQRFPATLQLAIAGLFVELAIGLPLGLLAASRKGSWFDRGSTTATIILVSAPSFWVGYLLLEVIFQLNRNHINIFPVGGGYKPWDLPSIIPPALAVGFGGAAYYQRLIRATMVEELHRDYVRTARAKGLPEERVQHRHALRNAIGPILIQIGLDLGFFLGGIVVIEDVFSWPGIGKLAVDSIAHADVPLILGTVLFATLCIVVANLFVDIVNAVLDPRIRVT
jgi:peptide/nickel transport system permease protein